MIHQLLLVVFGVAFSLEFIAFGMQRATLLIAREADVPYQFAKALLPTWFPAIWIIRITKWGGLLTITYTWSWGVACGLFVVDFILSAILPIPYSLYTPVFRKRVARIKEENSETGELLERILCASKRHGA